MISHLLEHALRSRSLHVHGDTGIFGFERAVPHGIGSCRGRAQTTVIYALTMVACSPGAGRTPARSQALFGALMKAWAESGATVRHLERAW